MEFHFQTRFPINTGPYSILGTGEWSKRGPFWTHTLNFERPYLVTHSKSQVIKAIRRHYGSRTFRICWSFILKLTLKNELWSIFTNYISFQISPCIMGKFWQNLCGKSEKWSIFAHNPRNDLRAIAFPTSPMGPSSSPCSSRYFTLKFLRMVKLSFWQICMADFRCDHIRSVSPPPVGDVWYQNGRKMTPGVNFGAHEQRSPPFHMLVRRYVNIQ